MNEKRALAAITNEITEGHKTSRRSKKRHAAKNTNYNHEQSITKYFPVEKKSRRNEEENLNTSHSHTTANNTQKIEEISCDAFMAALTLPAYQTFEDVCKTNSPMMNNNNYKVTDSRTITAQQQPIPPFFRISANKTQLTNDGSDCFDDCFDSDASDCGCECGGTGGSSTTEPTNIFLQKPVLHLDIDKSPNQASSIVINKHLNSNFTFASAMVSQSTPTTSSCGSSSETTSSVDDSMENMVSEKPRKINRKRKLMKTRSLDNYDAHDSDTNSCDSGVVAEISTDDEMPTTSHRIFCTMPVRKLQQERTAKLSALQNAFSVLSKQKRRILSVKSRSNSFQRQTSLRYVPLYFLSPLYETASKIT